MQEHKAQARAIAVVHGTGLDTLAVCSAFSLIAFALLLLTKI
jgi:hypothetical protein